METPRLASTTVADAASGRHDGRGTCGHNLQRPVPRPQPFDKIEVGLVLGELKQRTDGPDGGAPDEDFCSDRSTAHPAAPDRHAGC